MTWVNVNRETLNPAVVDDCHNGLHRSSVLGNAENEDTLWLTFADPNEPDRADIGEEFIGGHVESIGSECCELWCETVGEVCLGEASCPSQNLGHELEVAIHR